MNNVIQNWFKFLKWICMTYGLRIKAYTIDMFHLSNNLLFFDSTVINNFVLKDLNISKWYVYFAWAKFSIDFITKKSLYICKEIKDKFRPS